MKLIKTLIATLALLAPLSFAADISVMHAKVREVPPGATVSGAFMMLKNSGETDVSVVSAKSSAAEVVELHETSMKDGVMQMQMTPSLLIPAQGMLELKPGGYHLMLINLSSSFKEGDIVEIELSFDNGEVLVVDAKVMKIAKMSDMKHDH